MDREGFASKPIRPKCWDDLFEITNHLMDVPISEIEQGRLDWEYEFSSGDLRACGRQGCKQGHAHGWLVALAGRRFVNIGIDCAQKYGNNAIWKSMIDGYKEGRRKEARGQAVASARDRAQELLNRIDTDVSLSQKMNIFESFCRQAQGPLLNEIRRKADANDQDVTAEFFLSNEEFELRRSMASGTSVARVELRKVGSLVGLACFRFNLNFPELKRDLEAISKKLLSQDSSRVDHIAKRALTALLNDSRALEARFENSLSAFDQFFSESNLASVILLESARKGRVSKITISEDVITILRSSVKDLDAA